MDVGAWLSDMAEMISNNIESWLWLVYIVGFILIIVMVKTCVSG